MQSWINKAKETIHDIIDKVIEECKEDGSLKCRVCFVGYRDFGDARRFEVMPFNENLDEVKAFIAKVRADGGNDECEDVQGGLKVALCQDWTEEATKRVVLITDAPPHGKQFHGGKANDNYPNGGPEGLKLADLMKEFCKKDIDFQVIKLNNSVDKTIEVMKECHQEVDVVDMSGVRQEMRAARMEAFEASGEAAGMGGGGGGGAVAAAPTEEEVETYMKSKFVAATSKGIAMKCKAKKMKC